VGGTKGWTFFIDKSWDPPVIYEGDFLKFNWTSNAEHTVYQLTTAENYRGLQLQERAPVGEKTNVVIGPLIAARTLYFACAVSTGTAAPGRGRTHRCPT